MTITNKNPTLDQLTCIPISHKSAALVSFPFLEPPLIDLHPLILDRSQSGLFEDTFNASLSHRTAFHITHGSKLLGQGLT